MAIASTQAAAERRADVGGAAPTGNVDVRQLPLGGRIDDFLNVVDYVYRDDPAFVRPLDMDLKDRLNPRKNPFFEHGEAALFCAYRNGWPVGRCSVSIDREHLGRYRDDTGFFGFFDTIDDENVARALLARAEGWLRGKGMKRVRGPVSLNINEELGCLVDGFGTSPYIMMPHHRRYQGGLIEQAGYAKAKDVYAWHYKVGELNNRVRRAHEEIKNLPEISVRKASLKDIDRDVELLVEFFNDTWSENWGFVPFTRAEVKKMAADFRLLLMPDITCIVNIDGEPAAMAVALPNLNEMVRDMDGKLLPFGLPKLLWRLKVEGPKSARLILLGIRRKWRHVRKYAPLSVFMYAEMNEGAKRLGIREGELSWTLEDNGRVNAGIMMMGAKQYKTYRVYERGLPA
jgi:hypothetical protein